MLAIIIIHTIILEMITTFFTSEYICDNAACNVNGSTCIPVNMTYECDCFLEYSGPDCGGKPSTIYKC